MSAPTISVSYVSKATIVETSTDPFVAVDNATVSYNGLDTSETLDASSTPPVSVHAEFSKAMSGGAGTINFRLLPGPHGETLDCNGLKLQMFKFINPATNANSITVSAGASNGYDFMGASGLIVLDPGDEIEVRYLDTKHAVDDTHKTIDLAGTLPQALTCLFIFG